MVERDATFNTPKGFEDKLAEVKMKIAQLKNKTHYVSDNYGKNATSK